MSSWELKGVGQGLDENGSQEFESLLMEDTIKQVRGLGSQWKLNREGKNKVKIKVSYKTTV